uniref:UCH domain-containing protein n=1 Tax=Macrostomum lignano TaxID=282301 RepID=A0A1I8HGB4_9PLAT
ILSRIPEARPGPESSFPGPTRARLWPSRSPPMSIKQVHQDISKTITGQVQELLFLYFLMHLSHDVEDHGEHNCFVHKLCMQCSSVAGSRT